MLVCPILSGVFITVCTMKTHAVIPCATTGSLVMVACSVFGDIDISRAALLGVLNNTDQIVAALELAH
jgi:hypothetical protein